MRIGAAVGRLGLRYARGFLPIAGWALAVVANLGLVALGADPGSAAAGETALRPELLFLCVLFPLLAVTSGGWGSRWRDREVEWLAPLALPRGCVALSAQLGVLLAALLATGLCILGVRHEQGLAGAEPAWRARALLPHPVRALVEGDEPCTWRLEGLRATGDDELSLRPSVAPGSGPAVSLRFAVEDDTGVRGEVRARIHQRTRVRLPVPADLRGDPVLRLEREGPGAVLVLPSGSLEWTHPLARPELARLRLPLELGLLCWAWCALGLGLGAWMRPAIAAGLTLALASLPLWIGAEAAALPWPGSGLSELWQAARRALVPMEAHLGPARWGALLAIGCGVGLTWCGVRRGRGSV